MSRRELVPFRTALKSWLRLGFINFGGPAGQIAIMHEELVDKKRWIFLGAPFIERLRGNQTIDATMTAVTAAVVGGSAVAGLLYRVAL